jgi:hypothetical protein
MTPVHSLTRLFFKIHSDRAMAQVVSRRPLIAEDRVRARVSPCGICGGQSGSGSGFSPSTSVSPVSIFPPWFSMLIYHMGDEQEVRW